MKAPHRFNTSDLMFCVLLFWPILDGCLFLPHRTSEPQPFSYIEKSVRLGQTKNEILQLCGKPNATRLGERIFFYASWTRPLAIFSLILPPIDIKSNDKAIPFYDSYLLIIEFDSNNVVVNYKVQGDAGDLANGLYIIRSGVYFTFWPDIKPNFSDERFILGASEPMDIEAKRFAPYPDKSVIYLYKDFSDISDIKLDDFKSADPGVEGFLMWVVEPGNHSVSASQSEYRVSIDVGCNPSTIYYVEHKKKSLSEISKDIAEKEILKRRLVIDRLNMLRF